MAVRVALISNTAWSIYNFRSGLIKALRDEGYEVVGIAPPDDYAPRLDATGARYVPLAMDNKGTNPWSDVRLCLALRRILKTERIACVLSFTIKPNLYGALAARSVGICAISNVSGLGTIFIKPSWVTRIARLLYRIGLGAASRVFFQNPDDRDYFIKQRLVSPAKAMLVPGSGIDTSRYCPAPGCGSTRDSSNMRFLLLGRMLWDKGIGEYVQAVQMLQDRGVRCDAVLMGFLGAVNATAIAAEQIAEWQSRGLVTYLPATDDVRDEIAKSDCIVLPSYREGTPRSLLEAAAMGKPIITTDVPGCRQVVDDRRTGFLVKVKDAADLASKMEQIVRLSHAERERMGQSGREKMLREFDERVVIDVYLRTLRELLGVRARASD